MLPTFCKDTVTVMRAQFTDSRGSKVRDWANAESHTEACCSVQPASTSGTDTNREATSITMVLYAPPTADVRAGDRVTFGGSTFEVVGVPFEWRSPTGTTSHITCNMSDWEG